MISILRILLDSFFSSVLSHVARIAFLVILGVTSASAICGPVEPDGIPELEPNDDFMIAQPLPFSDVIFGEQNEWMDSDFYLLDPIPPEMDLHVELQLDFLDLILRIFVLEDGVNPVLISEHNEGGFCQPESGTVQWDPCDVLIPAGPVVLEVSQNQALPPSQGNYLISAQMVPTSGFPQGDCCEYPIEVPSFPYTDSQNTGSNFRDQGFNSSADVWYHLSVSSKSVLTAKTCNTNTNFDTELRVIGNDCTTVIASNDDSKVCGMGSFRSWLVTCLDPGDYFVMVEGAGSATGNYTLDLKLVSGGSSARLVVGEWGEGAESWHNIFYRESSSLWLLCDDPCGRVTEVAFEASSDGVTWLPLGTDSDGSEARLATEHTGLQGEKGWQIDFNPDLLSLPAQGGDVQFRALILSDGVLVSQCETVSTYSPALGPEHLSTTVERETVVEAADLSFDVISDYPWTLGELRWKLGLKEMDWSRNVPHEYQRNVSDTHCSPTAAAACLEWLDATYGTNVTGGYSGELLTVLLGVYFDTNVGGAGTSHSGLRNGLQEWIDDNGGGYTVHHNDGGVSGMQDQGEMQGQDVIATLEWAGGGAHSVTLSSIHNEPAPDGSILLDFMDPWTGDTEYGWFDSATGNFELYGSNNDSGQLGTTYYVCPTETQPGDGGDDSGGYGVFQPPFMGPLGIPVPLGHWFLKFTFVSQDGHSRDVFHILHKPEAAIHDLRIEYVAEAGFFMLNWSALEGAATYRVCRSEDFELPPEEWEFLENTTQPHLQLPTNNEPGRWFFRVRAMADAPN